MAQNFQPPLPPQPPPPLPPQPCPAAGGKARTTLLPPPPPPVPEPPVMPWRPQILNNLPRAALALNAAMFPPPFPQPPIPPVPPMFGYNNNNNNQMAPNFFANDFQTYNNNQFQMPTNTYCQLNPDPTNHQYQENSSNMEESHSDQDQQQQESQENEDQNANDVDDTEDWQRCAVCDIEFENELAFSRHCRGLIHCQRLLEKQKDAGLIEADPPPKPLEAEVDANLQRTKNVDPNKRDIMPDELGGPMFYEKYFCADCSCSCSGPEAYEAHLKGKRHAKTLKSKISAGIKVNSVIPSARLPSEPAKVAAPAPSSEAVETGQRAELQNVIDKCPEPLIGLKYVVEYISPINPTRYVCNLCEAKCDANTIIPHLIGFKHRLKFLKEVRCELYAEIQLCADDKSQQTELLITRCQELETEEGRPSIVQRLEILNKDKSASENLRSYLHSSGRASPTQRPKRLSSPRPPNGKDWSGEIDVNRLVTRREKSPPRKRDKRRRRDRSRSRSRSRSRFDDRPWLSASDFKKSSPGPSRSNRSRSPVRSPKYDDRRDTPREQPSIMKQLLQALVNASTNREDPDAIRLSTALTNAILKVKTQQQQQHQPPPLEMRPPATYPMNNYSLPPTISGYSMAEPQPAYSSRPKPKLGSSYYR